MDNLKLETIADFLRVDTDQIEEGYNENIFEFGNEEYLVVTDGEAYELAEEYIKESLWAFRPSFLAEHSKVSEDIFQALQEKCFEDANEVILNSIIDIDDLVYSAIRVEGIGHFLNSYDGEEESLNDLYIYRIN
jgi:hypothetical protein